MQAPKITRRDILTVGTPVLSAALISNPAVAQASTTEEELSSVLGITWPARRKEIERHWLDLLGEFPSSVPLPQPIMKFVTEDEGIKRYHVSFQSEPDDRVIAWLLVPKAAKGERTPAIINIHSTTFGAGKDSTAGLAGRRPIDPPTDPVLGRASGLELARHGYITLNIDLLTDGERIEPSARVMDTRGFYLRHPEWSIVGKNTWDIMRSVDFLQSLDFVDGEQIGCIGWSLGGHTSLFAAAFEPRITAAISNGGVLDWHRTTPAWSRQPASWIPWKKGDPETSSPEIERRFGFKSNSGPYIYIKRFRQYIDDQSKQIPVDFDSLMAMVAPRPLLIISSEQEFWRHKVLPKCLEASKVYHHWRDAEGLPSVVAARMRRRGYDETLKYYKENYNISAKNIQEQFKAMGAGDCFSWFSFPGGHSYPPVARDLTFAWYDRWLGHAMS